VVNSSITTSSGSSCGESPDGTEGSTNEGHLLISDFRSCLLDKLLEKHLKNVLFLYFKKEKCNHVKY